MADGAFLLHHRVFYFNRHGYLERKYLRGGYWPPADSLPTGRGTTDCSFPEDHPCTLGGRAGKPGVDLFLWARLLQLDLPWPLDLQPRAGEKLKTLEIPRLGSTRDCWGRRRRGLRLP